MPQCFEFDRETGKGCQFYGKKSASCLYCANGKNSLIEDHHDGQTFCNFDTINPADIAYQVYSDSENIDVALNFVKIIMTLETMDREILLRSVAGDTLARISTRLSFEFNRKITVQAIHARLKKMAASYDLAEILTCRSKKMKGKRK